MRLARSILLLCASAFGQDITIHISTSSNTVAITQPVSKAEQLKQADNFRAMQQLAASPANFQLSRPAQDFATVHVPPTHTVKESKPSLDELLDRWRTNRDSVIVLVTEPNTNANRVLPMPHRR